MCPEMFCVVDNVSDNGRNLSQQVLRTKRETEKVEKRENVQMEVR